MAIRKQTHRQLVKESGMIARECALHVGNTIEAHKRTVDQQIQMLNEQRAADLGEVVKMRAEIQALTQGFEQWKVDAGKKMDDIHTTVTGISMVKLNGGPAIPIGEAMRELWMATAGIRSWGKVAQSWHEWQEKTALGRFTRTKLGRILTIGAAAFLASAVLDFVGLVRIDVSAATRWALQIIFKQGVQP